MECFNLVEKDHPVVAEAIRNNFYVDDMLRSEHNADTAFAFYHELNAIMDKFSLQLAKWVTNDHAVNAANNGGIVDTMELDKEQTNAVLGIHWHPINDEFRFKIKNPPSDEEPTKRSIVSDSARLFDPNGFLSPIMIRAQMIVQRLWLRKIDWDDNITDPIDGTNDFISIDWKGFRQELPQVENIRILRWIGVTSTSKSQLHGFSDASQDAYGIAFYIRVTDIDSDVKVHLVFSKTRVAPMTKATVPKLELSAAHLLSKLLSPMMEAHNVTIDNCYLWTESMVTLQWIRKSPAKLEVFQANRVAEIQEWTEGATWSHVTTKDNPSDLCSRGTSPDRLRENSL